MQGRQGLDPYGQKTAIEGGQMMEKTEGNRYRGFAENFPQICGDYLEERSEEHTSELQTLDRISGALSFI